MCVCVKIYIKYVYTNLHIYIIQIQAEDDKQILVRHWIRRHFVKFNRKSSNMHSLFCNSKLCKYIWFTSPLENKTFRQINRKRGDRNSIGCRITSHQKQI